MENIEALLKQAELQHKSIELNLMFAKNMEFFQAADPQIYSRYANYTPTELQLAFTEDGNINLFSLGTTPYPIYQQDPLTFCREYIDQYQKNPKALQVTASTTKALDVEKSAHINNMNPLIEFMNSKPDNPTKELEDSTQFFLVLGLGIGFQIPQLLEKTNVHHMCIVEPHEDNFYASLYTVDWKELYHYFNREFCTLNLILGQTSDISFEMIRNYIDQIGVFNAIKPYVIDHFQSAEMKKFTQVFFERLPVIVGTMGYFDDEQVSLSHSVENYRNQIPILHKQKSTHKPTIDRPAFVIANGPSLDSAIEFIKNHQNQFILISCGTALGSLCKAGIKPDFHVEMERTRPVVEWIETSTTAEFRKNIIFLGLNTLHPDTFSLFSTCGMALKTNDLGAHFISQHSQKSQELVDLSLSNPTVGNTGMALAIKLGFSEIYLAGLDFGFASDGQHHSSLSKHYDIKDEHQEGLNLYKATASNNILLPGNFGNQITTTTLYSFARTCIEALLSRNPHVNCYNTSQGVLINGAQPTPVSSISCKQNNLFNKEEYCQTIYRHNFNFDRCQALPSNTDITSKFEAALTFLKKSQQSINEQIHTREEAYNLLSQQHKAISSLEANEKDLYSYWLLKGSENSFESVLAKCLYKGASNEQGVELFNAGLDYYRRFLQQAEKKINASLLEKNVHTRNLSKKLKH